MEFSEKNFIFLDAETDGLYGGFLTVGIVVTDFAGRELERICYGIRRENLRVKDPWVAEHVLPVLGEYEPCEDEEELLERVWALWRRYAENAYVVADVAFPVEARLFQRCVLKNPKERRFQAPFPLLDLGSILFAKGIDPLTDRVSLSEAEEKAKRHNALSDAAMAAKIFHELMNGEKK